MNKSKQDILQQRIKGFLTYWAGRQRNAGAQIVSNLPKDQDWETLQDTVNISGRIFNIIYTKIGQAIWTKVLVQEQYSGRVQPEELPSPQSRGKSQESQAKTPKAKVQTPDSKVQTPGQPTPR